MTSRACSIEAMPITLALDTSTNQGGLAILRASEVLVEKLWSRRQSHGEVLTAILEDCLQEARISISDLNRICVGQGPGSFTGARIGVNIARTLAYGLNIPVFVFDTMQILAAQIVPVPPRSRPLLALVNAHRNLVYASRFRPQTDGTLLRTHGPLAVDITDLEKLVTEPHDCVGDGYLELQTLFSSELQSRLIRDSGRSDYPLPSVLGRIPESLLSQPLDWKLVQPLYIRASEAEEKLRGR